MSKEDFQIMIYVYNIYIITYILLLLLLLYTYYYYYYYILFQTYILLRIGSVAVYSACDKQSKPLYCSTAKTGKHTDPVWEVCLAKNCDQEILCAQVESL